jgi:hypothetical protein
VRVCVKQIHSVILPWSRLPELCFSTYKRGLVASHEPVNQGDVNAQLSRLAVSLPSTAMTPRRPSIPWPGGRKLSCMLLSSCVSRVVCGATGTATGGAQSVSESMVVIFNCLFDGRTDARMDGRTTEGRRKDDGRTAEGRWKDDGRTTEGRRKAGGRPTEGRRKAGGRPTEGRRKADGRTAEICSRTRVSARGER